MAMMVMCVYSAFRNIAEQWLAMRRYYGTHSTQYIHNKLVDRMTFYSEFGSLCVYVCLVRTNRMP